MCEAQEHRGPDARGLHLDAGIGLGIQRLRVIDLLTGDQPIHNEDRTITVVLNGEIYNYRELRKGLAERGHRLATEGDTEVIVHLYEELGPSCVRELHGMFAFALWDSRSAQLLLARPLAADLRRPWETRPPDNRPLSPGRVRRGFANIHARLGTPAHVAKPARPGPGRPKGPANRPAPRYPVPKKTSTTDKQSTQSRRSKVKT